MRVCVPTVVLALLAGCPQPDTPKEDDTSTPAPDDTDTTTPDDGDDTSGPTTGDDSGTPAASTVAPRQDGTTWVFEAAGTRLVVDPTAGARVTSFSLDGAELLSDATVDPDNYGATLWTSPQSDWSWPPPAGIDTAAYTASLDGDALVLQSTPTTVGSATFTAWKRISMDTAGVVTLEYRIANDGAASASVAGWQVARVPGRGITFFPEGEIQFSPTGSFPTTSADGYVWYDATTRGGDAKLLADGTRGWLAHASDGVLFLQTFPDVAMRDQAPGEREIELFRAATGYDELELQGPYATLAPGESASLTITWTARALPGDVEVAAGSASLASFVESATAAR